MTTMKERFAAGTATWVDKLQVTFNLAMMCLLCGLVFDACYRVLQ